MKCISNLIKVVPNEAQIFFFYITKNYGLLTNLKKSIKLIIERLSLRKPMFFSNRHSIRRISIFIFDCNLGHPNAHSF